MARQSSLANTTIPDSNFEVHIPRAPRLPSDLAELQAYCPMSTTLVAVRSRSERKAYILSLIKDALCGH